jgi:hypothetical protein
MQHDEHVCSRHVDWQPAESVSDHVHGGGERASSIGCALASAFGISVAATIVVAIATAIVISVAAAVGIAVSTTIRITIAASTSGATTTCAACRP